MVNKQSNILFTQSTNWNNFSNEIDLKSQDIENDSRIQESQRKHLINKTQKVNVDEEFEYD